MDYKGKSPLKKVTTVEESYSMGMDIAVTLYGHTVPCYNAERTLCDIFRADIEMQEKQFAVKKYLNGKKNPPRLMEYAKLLHVEKNQTIYGGTAVIHMSRQLKALIRNKSQGDNAKATTLIRHFVMERLLERISFSEYSDKLILKGGLLNCLYGGTG